MASENKPEYVGTKLRESLLAAEQWPHLAPEDRWACFEALENELCIPKISASGRDLLLKLISEGPIWRAWLAGLSVLLLALIPVVIASFEGVLVNPGLSPDLLHDLGYWFAVVLPAPVLAVTLCYYLRQLPISILQICFSNVILVTKKELVEFSKSANRIYRHRCFVILPWAASIIVTALVICTFVLGSANSWHSPTDLDHVTLAAWSHIPICAIWVYFMGAFFSRIVASSLVLRLLFRRFRANIQPLHPDGCGGLYPLGKLCSRLNLLVFIIGLSCVAGVTNNVTSFGWPLWHINNILIFVAYFAGAVLVFFVHLFPAHRSMAWAKLTTMELINSRFQSLHEQLVMELATGDSLQADLEQRIERLRKAYEIARVMPVYPFNTRIIASFLASILMPLFGIVANELVSNAMHAVMP